MGSGKVKVENAFVHVAMHLNPDRGSSATTKEEVGPGDLMVLSDGYDGTDCVCVWDKNERESDGE